MADNTLKEFLVKLGYQLDTNSEKRMLDSVVHVTAVVLKLGVAVEAAAAGVVIGVAKMADSLEQLYFMSQRTQSSAANINAFSYAVSQMGGTVDGAKSSIESFARFLISPGSKGLVESAIGHPIKDTTTALQEFVAYTSTMPDYLGKAYAEMAGIDYNTWYSMRYNLGKFSAEHAEMVKRIGLNEDRAAKKSQEFMNRFRAIGDLFNSLYEKITSDIAGGLTKNLDKFRDTVEAYAPQIQKVITAIVTGVLFAADAISRFSLRLIDATSDIYNWFLKLDPTMQKILETVGLIGAAWILLNRSFLSTPIGQILTLTTALVALYDDYKTWQEHGKSLIDWAKWQPTINDAIKGVEDLVQALREFYHQHKPTVDAIIAMTVAWEAFNLVAKASPIYWIAALIAGISALVIDFERWKRTGEVGLVDWAKWEPTIKKAMEAFDVIASKLDKLVEAVGGWQGAMTLFLEYLAGKWLIGVVSTFGRVLGLTSILNAAFTGIGTGAFATLVMRLTALGAVLGLVLTPTTPNAQERSDLGKFQNGGEGAFPDTSMDGPKKPEGLVTRMGKWLGIIPDTPTTPPLTGEQKKKNARESYLFWRNSGLGHEATMALLGNEQKESGFNPDDEYQGAKGVFQWLKPRRDAILAATGIDVWNSSHADQLYAAHYEMTHGLDPGATKMWQNLHSPGDRDSYQPSIQTDYERPADIPGDISKSRGYSHSLEQTVAPLNPDPSLGPQSYNTNHNVNQNNNITISGSPSDTSLEKLRQTLSRSYADIYRATVGSTG